MTPLAAVEPHLYTLRSVARAAGRSSDLEGARFQLYRAFADGDQAKASGWARACRAAVLALEDNELRELGLDALEELEEAIGEGTT